MSRWRFGTYSTVRGCLSRFRFSLPPPTAVYIHVDFVVYGDVGGGSCVVCLVECTAVVGNFHTVVAKV